MIVSMRTVRVCVVRALAYVLLLESFSGLTSPNRTTVAPCTLARKLRKRDRVTFPAVTTSTLTCAGPIGESKPIVTCELN